MNTSRLLFTCNLRKQKRVRRIHIFVGRKFHHQNASPYFPLYMRCTILRYPSSIVSASSSRTLLQDQSFDDFIRRLRPLIHFQRSSIWIHFLIFTITFCAINNINPSSQNNRDTGFTNSLSFLFYWFTGNKLQKKSNSLILKLFLNWSTFPRFPTFYSIQCACNIYHDFSRNLADT